MPTLIKRLSTLSLALVLALPACGKQSEDDDEEEDEAAADAPPPPSPYTVSIDTSVAEGGTNTDAEAAGTAFAFTTNTTQTGLIHLGASLVVASVSYSLAAQLLVPVLLLKGAGEATPIEVTPDTYLWSFDFENGAKYTGNLTGTKDEASGVNSFSMSVTRDPENGDGCCTNFVFFSGTNNPTTGAGAWQIFDPTRSSTSENLFSVAYNFTSVTDRTLTYTVNSDRPAAQKFGAGTSVVYAVKGTSVVMTYQDSSEPGSRIITWDKDTLAGSIVDLQGQKLCWDTKENKFADIPCED